MKKINIKSFNKFLNEDLGETTQNMENTTQVYNKYKSRIQNMVDKEDTTKSQEDFESFVDTLPDDEKPAIDMLRSLFSSEMIQVSIEKLEQDKENIEQQIKNRMEELKNIQDKLN